MNDVFCREGKLTTTTAVAPAHFAHASFINAAMFGVRATSSPLTDCAFFVELFHVINIAIHVALDVRIWLVYFIIVWLC